MKLSPDDPQLTAYALGELGEAERAAVEDALQDAPECRAAVEEIRATAERLTGELAAEPCPELMPAQRDALESPAAGRMVPFPWWRLWRSVGLTGAAACLVALVGWALIAPKVQSERADQRSGKVQPRPNGYESASRIITPESQSYSGPPVAGTGFTSQLWSGPTGGSAENQGTAGTRAILMQLNASSGKDRNLSALTQLAAAYRQQGQAPYSQLYVNNGNGQFDFGDSGVTHAQFSPDGLRLLSASDDKTVRIWDAPTGRPLPWPHPIAAYSPFIENAFVPILQEPLSTFSIDVDTASYANVRRFLNSGQLPPRDAVRIEELVNYFTYTYPAPRGDDPFSASIETAGCPWAPEHRIVRVGLRGRDLPRGKRPPSNFVFLIDVSGSMQPAERLPLLKQALRALVKMMNESDRVAIVVYASEAGVKLESTSCAEKEKILAAIDALEAGGSTNGGEGIQQAYATARRHHLPEGVNRVILCTDGDFNVGLTDQNALVALAQEHAAGGTYLTALGVGTDNYKDALMQRLADRANGNYHYLDTLEEATKVLVEQMNANFVTIAKDVKVQVEFNPAQVSAYRLIGYEKRLLRAPDFNNDRKDAGEIGAGHTVTAFYEILPAGVAAVRPIVDQLKYQSAVAPASYSVKGESSKELLTLKLRYKQPDSDTSKLLEFPHTDSGSRYGQASADFKFATSVVSFGMILRGSEHKGSATFETVLELAGEGKGADDGGWRAEFINLVRKAMRLRGKATFE